MMIVAAAAAVLLLTMIISMVRKWRKSNEANRNPPGPGGMPLVGNLLQFDASKPLDYLQKLYRDYGPIVFLNHASTPTVLLSSPKLAKQILKTHDLSLCTRPPVLGQQKLSYNGADMAFSPYNRHWKEMRKMCMLHLFSPTRVLSFRPVRESQVARMIAKISASSAPVNMSELAMSVASNIVCGVAFGRTYEDHEYEKKRIDRLVLEAQALMVKFYFSDHFPALSWVDRVSGLLGRLDRNFSEMDEFCRQLIQEHLNPATPAREREDIIDLMIQLKKLKPDSINWDHVKALLMNLFVAGTDTAAAAIVWTMTALMLKPTVMKKAQTQIRQAIGGKGVVDEDDIGKLPYLKAVVLESLRLYPPAPLLYRTHVDDHGSSIDIDGYKIKPGTTLIINGWAIARDPETWEDPDEFLPERFMTGDGGGVRQMVEFEMIPFGGGRRRCPGMGMGLVSIELALANLLYSFDWSPATATVETEALPGLTVHKKNPLLLLPTPYLHSDAN